MKYRILASMTSICVMGVFAGVMALDSESNIPIIVCGVCMLWLLLFIYTNRDQLGPLDEYEE